MWEIIVLGFINTEGNEAAEQKTEQTAPGSSPGLIYHPKMGASSYIPPRVFEPQSDSELGPAGPIALNDPAAKLRGTSSKGTSKTADHRSGRMSLSQAAARVAGKPRIQRPGKFTCEATKGKGKDNTSWQASSYLPVSQELPFDSDSEGARAVIASVEHQQPRTDHQTKNMHCCNLNDPQYMGLEQVPVGQ
jgi:hypothetical protein